MRIGIIGGSALSHINIENTWRQMVNTPYGSPSCPVTFGQCAGNEIVFLPRHGMSHTIAPHEVNYRANLSALHQLEVTHVIAAAAVGGISENMAPMKLVFPDQVIDYTYSRKHTYHERDHGHVNHVDFTDPYDEHIRKQLIRSAESLSLQHVTSGTYGATQGPRLETAAEIQRLKRDGCDVVGMTGMPEAALARELGLKYATCGLVVNWAAGIGPERTISINQIEQNLKSGSDTIMQLLYDALPKL
jgi:5'-methylthioinosine phosphorylase